MNLKNRIAIVTGGGQGIGRAIVLKLAQEGVKVAIADIDESKAKETLAEIQKQGAEGIVIKTDVAEFEQVKAMVQNVIQHFQRVDILVNNAGWDRLMPFVKTDPDFWKKVISINLMGAINFCRAVADAMISQNAGKIVNIGSDAGRVGSTGEAVYSAAKGGVIAFTKTLARELSRYNITVNCVCPGPTDTPLLNALMSDEKGAKVMEAIKKSTPLGRLAKPEEIASAVAFFASDEANFITGQVLSVSGGLTMAG